MPKRILVIDDDAFMRRLIEIILKRDGYDVIGAESAHEGLNVLHQQHVDGITCDLMMPVMGGNDFLEQVKQHSDFKKIPVIIVTAAGLQDEIERSHLLGAVATIEKPFTDSELRQVMARALEEAL